MKVRILGALTALLLSTSVASAAIDVNALAQEYVDLGYTRIEVEVGATLVKVEAIKDGTKLEVTYNLESGAIVKSETEAVDADEDTSPGVFIDTEGDDEDGGDDDVDDDEDDDEDDDGNSGSDDDEDDDEDEDDDNSGSGGGDDD